MGDNNRVEMTGIFSKGYGLAPKMVMQDQNLTIEAKAIYAYMASFAGNGASAFPSINKVCNDLNISKNRFLKHRKKLVDAGYIDIQKKRVDGKFENNVYMLNHTVASKRNHVVSNHRHGDLPPRQNEATNNNSYINNNNYLISSSSKGEGAENAFAFYENNFGVLSPFIAENINHWINQTSEELVIESMKLALKANKGFNYAEGILKRWKKNNIKTINDVRASETEFERNVQKKNKKKDKSVFEYDPTVDSF